MSRTFKRRLGNNTALHVPLVGAFIRREERQLEQAFGEEWRRYKERVRRWL